jgi:mannitol/fructose-specific phosphotransferase system IIA component
MKGKIKKQINEKKMEKKKQKAIKRMKVDLKTKNKVNDTFIF